jgi:hypothetical protein
VSACVSERERERDEAVGDIIPRHVASGSLPILSDNCTLSQYSHIFIALIRFGLLPSTVSFLYLFHLLYMYSIRM